MDIRRALTSREASAELAAGQIVVVTARWLLVLAGLVFALWDPGEIGRLRIQLLALFLLAVGNFYLHAQLLMRRPAIDAVAYGSSAIDLAIISLLVLSGDGFASHLYVFYFPALLALSVAFPPAMSALFTGAAVGLYGLISVGELGTALTEGHNLPVLLVRLLMMTAVAVCGGLFWRIEADRRGKAIDRATGDGRMRSQAEDLFFGQAVITWARWFVVLGAMVVALWTAETPSQLTGRIVLVVTLMAANLFLHGRYLVERPANQLLLTVASLVDVAAITAVVVLWGDRGLDSPYFVFLYPMLFAAALVFPPLLAIGYGAVSVATYAAVCLLADPGLLSDGADAKRVTMRLITLGAMAGLGAFYWRIQRARLADAVARPSAVAIGEPINARAA